MKEFIILVPKITNMGREYRKNKIYTIGISECLYANKNILRKIYKKFIFKRKKFEKRGFTIKSAAKMLSKF